MQRIKAKGQLVRNIVETDEQTDAVGKNSNLYGTHVFELGENRPQSVRRAAQVTCVSMLTSNPQSQHLGDASRVRKRPLR